LSCQSTRGGSVLIIVLWVALGLISVALYFGNSMSLEMRAADNRLATLQAQQAIAGATRYVAFVLSNSVDSGSAPDPLTYVSEAVPVGDSLFWLIGRATNIAQVKADTPVYGLIDEASKLNLNTATVDMLSNLTRMTPQLAAAIIDWRDSDDTPTVNGAESDIYSMRMPPYRAKNAKFETVEELRMVWGADLDILYGEDSNLNGTLDLNENDGDASPPSDNRDSRLDPGILEYLTVYSRESVLRTDGSGSNKVNVATAAGVQQLQAVLGQRLGTDRGGQIARLFTGPGRQPATNMLQFYVRSQMTPDEFAQVEGDITFSDQPIDGLVNINTAPQEVLACIPGIGPDNAAAVAGYRQNNSGSLQTVAWLTQAIDQQSALRAAPYITTHSFQFTADIAAVGHNGRGYQRVKVVFDTADGTPQIKYRQDLSRLGWALGRTTRTLLLSQRYTR
jgi:type II secretory pathway component PulK